MIHLDIFFDIFKNSLAGKIILSVLTGMVGSALLVVFFFPLLSSGGLLKALPWIVGFNAALTGYTLVDKTRTLLKCRHLVTATAGAICAASTWIVVSAAAVETRMGIPMAITDGVTLLAVGIATGWLGGVLAIKYFSLGLEGKAH